MVEGAPLDVDVPHFVVLHAQGLLERGHDFLGPVERQGVHRNIELLQDGVRVLPHGLSDGVAEARAELVVAEIDFP